MFKNYITFTQAVEKLPMELNILSQYKMYAFNVLFFKFHTVDQKWFHEYFEKMIDMKETYYELF